MLQALPQLLDDVPADPYTGIDADRTFVMLGANTYAPCHFHPSNEAISTQVLGRRRFVLFAADQRPYLYPRKAYQFALPNFSHVDWQADDIAKWPLLAQAQGHEAILEPGDSIYLPVQYWHAVFSLDGLSVLLARFFPSSFRRYHYPTPGLTVLAWHAFFFTPMRLLDLTLGNAMHIKNVPGRKTDVKDSEWLAVLLRHGLIRKSYVPPKDLRELRELLRYRIKLVQSRTAEL